VSTVQTHPRVDDYLRRLHAASWVLPPDRRAELVLLLGQQHARALLRGGQRRGHAGGAAAGDPHVHVGVTLGGLPLGVLGAPVGRGGVRVQAAQVAERSPWISADARDTLMAHPAKEHVMGVLGWIILGLLAGAIAKALHKGHEPGGVVGTLVVGVAGALVGGLIASAVGIGGIGSFFSLGTWLIAVGGALLLLVIYDALSRRGDSHGRRRATT
jgi:uncharacterized membrane protein YeaQ/YmgE (transglycosylase-associated protein family)